jgi:hypothetical protein
MGEVEQRSVIKFLWKEGCLAQNICARLQIVSGVTADAVLSVYSWIKEFKCGRDNIDDQPRSERLPIDNLDADILCVLHHSPFETVRSIAEEVGVSAATVHRRLTELLPLQPRLLKWVPHLLTCELKAKRVEFARELLEALRSEKHTLFHRIITGDEFWFYLDYSSDHIWTCATDDVPQRASHQIQTDKLMLTVLWSTRRPILVKWMERRQRFNTTYFISEIMSELVRNIKRTWNFPGKNPSILICDEPCAGIDVEARQMIWRAISSYPSMTSFINVHSIDEAESMTSRILVMSQGRAKFIGTPAAMRDEFKCGYEVAILDESASIHEIVARVREVVPEVRVDEDHERTLLLPADLRVGAALEAIGDVTYLVHLDSMEITIRKMIEDDEAQGPGSFIINQ